MTPCLGCNQVFPRPQLNDGRCATCKRAAWRAYNQRRDPVARQVYGSGAYRQARKAVLNGATHCAWCGKPESEVGKLTAGHLRPIRDDIAAATDPSGLAPQCRSCQELEKHRRYGGRR